MALFVMNGSFTPAHPVKLGSKQAERVLRTIRAHVAEIVGVPLLPVVWEDDSTLLAVDGSGGSVVVSLRASLSAGELFEIVSRSGRYTYMTRRELASRFAKGAEMYDAEWRAFSSKVPSERGPRLIIVLLEADEDVYPVLENLSGGVRVIRASVHKHGISQLLHTEPLRKVVVQDTDDVRVPAPSVDVPCEVPKQPESVTPVSTLGKDAAKILTSPRLVVRASERHEDADTPAYLSAREVQEVRRQRKEQLLWERSAPRREGGAARLISESAAANESSNAVNRAAERARLSPRARLEAIAARCHAPITLTLAGHGAAAKLTAWGTISVGNRSFTDPNAAAAHVLGREANGWAAWVAASGKSLEQL